MMPCQPRYQRDAKYLVWILPQPKKKQTSLLHSKPSIWLRKTENHEFASFVMTLMCLRCWCISFEGNNSRLPWRWSHQFMAVLASILRKLPDSTMPSFLQSCISMHWLGVIHLRQPMDLERQRQSLWHANDTRWTFLVNRWQTLTRSSNRQRLSLQHAMAWRHHALLWQTAVNRNGHRRLKNPQQPQSSAICHLQLRHLNRMSVEHITKSLCGIVLSVEIPLPWMR